MYKELSYETPEGYTVFTSQYLKNKGTCCKSSCLHCPYGFTIKKNGLEFEKMTEKDFPEIENLLKEYGQEAIDWKTFLPDNIISFRLKGHCCGFFLKNHIVIKHLFLFPRFQNQNLYKELIEAYFF
jgi:hypothetical protein